jgi:glycosyltransferase involved in cell wall biosynthesis
MRISLVIPNYNSGPVLERAIRSVLEQQYSDLELIVVDSLSTDESKDTIDKYRPQLSHLVREKDRGPADGINKGFARATGDIYAWLGADDELAPDAFHAVVNIFKEHPEADVVIGACERVFADGSRLITTPPPDALALAGRINLIEQPSCFWRAELHHRCGPLDATYKLAFDWELWCRMRDAGAKPFFTDRVLSHYYFSATNITSASGAGHVREATRILRKYGPLGGGLAYIYNVLFWIFDMHGCYDSPPTCTPLRARAFGYVLRFLVATIGRDLAYGYNWHFASRQARGLKWW